MRAPSLRSAFLIAAASVALSGCGTYLGNGLGVGVGYGNNGYGGYGGYGDPYSAGYGSGYGSPYGYNSSYGYNSAYGYNPIGYGYVPSYYGWYDNHYYPGTGDYVYDRNGSGKRRSDAQRAFWESRGAGVTVFKRTENWQDYRRATASTEQTESATPPTNRRVTRRDGDGQVRVRNSPSDQVQRVNRSDQIEHRTAARAKATARQEARPERRQERQAQRVERQSSLSSSSAGANRGRSRGNQDENPN